MKMKKGIWISLMLLFGLLFCGFSSEDRRVYDAGDFFTEIEEDRLEEQIREVRSDCEMDLVVVAIRDACGKASWQYAEWFYYDAGYSFGYENTDRGILYLIDMDNREIYVYCSEGASEEIHQDEIDSILDEVYDEAAEGQYYASAVSFVEAVKQVTGPPRGTLIIGAVISLIVVFILIKMQKTSVRAPHMAYMNQNSTRMYRREDRFIRTTLVKRKIETSTSSGSGSHSSGGSRFGGGSHSRGSGGGRSL